MPFHQFTAEYVPVLADFDDELILKVGAEETDFKNLSEILR